MICPRCGGLFFDESLLISPDAICSECEQDDLEELLANGSDLLLKDKTDNQDRL